MAQIVNTIKRGGYVGTVVQNGNQYTAQVTFAGKQVKQAGPFYDLDEAEVELGSILDTAWREHQTGPQPKLVRRI